jgi:hypothetical protein
MKSIVAIFAILSQTLCAQAETYRGQTNTPSTFKPFACDSRSIPEAVGASIDAALAEAMEVCAKPSISAVRILSLSPHGCGSWNPGYRPLVEIDVQCLQ